MPSKLVVFFARFAPIIVMTQMHCSHSVSRP